MQAYNVNLIDIPVNKMHETELKHVITLLLEDVKRLQRVEPNAGTEARIWIAEEALSKNEERFRGFAE